LRPRASGLASWTGVLLSLAAACLPAQQILYGGNEWLQFESPNTGYLVQVDQDTGAVTLIGRPQDVERISGLAFDGDGTLWATSLTGTPSGTVRTSTLIQLDPSDGSLLATIGPVVDGVGGPPIAIEALAFRPGTDELYGARGIADLGGHGGEIYRIDPATGVASLFAHNNVRLAMIAFSPDGTLYQSVANASTIPPSTPRLQTLDLSTGAVATSVPTARFFKALAFRADGVLFGVSPQNNTTTDVDDVFTIESATGILHFLGDTGNNPVGSLAFGPEVAGPCGEGCPAGPRSDVARAAGKRPDPRGVVRPPP
jgi:hypothetical protein